MTFHAKVLRDRWGSFEIVIHKDGIAAPTMLIGGYEFHLLCQEIETQKRDFQTEDKKKNSKSTIRNSKS